MIPDSPPRWLQRALLHFLNTRDRESISGDLLEEYREQMLPRLGVLASNLWYLRQLISFYGDSMQNLLPTYLEMSLDGFAKQQERFRSQFQQAFGGAPGLGYFDEQVSQNLAMFDRAMRMFSPFSFSNGAAGAMSPAHAEDAGAPAPTAAPASNQVDELRQQVEAMRAQIDALARKG